MAEMENDEKKVSEVAAREEEILAYWNEQKTFKASLEKPSPSGEYVFYDGPPFATGLPHHGHILAGTIKDAIPRYKTMRGFHVRRRWGWDSHGLPLENIIEKELGIKTKRDIEEMGVSVFNEAARSAVLRYADEWKRIVPRIGRWVDMEDDYKTMDTTYTESVWWAFKKLFDKDLIEEGFKVMQLCPRCGTTLSNFEVSQGYKDIKDITAYAKFELEDEPETYLLAWTTTPWTLPGNIALALGTQIEYVKVEKGGAQYILAKPLVEKVFGEDHGEVTPVTKSEILGRVYKPVFPGVMDALAEGKERDKLGAAFRVYEADFVTAEDGTGIVHIAPAFGEDDLNLSRAHGLPIVHHVDRDGRMMSAVPVVAGKLAKPKGQWWETDALIVEYLGEKLFKTEEKVHSYPHCWRCDTPLLNYASSSWFVRVPTFKDKLVAENDKVKWVPEAIGKNRFGDWLNNARDWAISRSRYWGAPIPVWKNEKTGALRVFGSVDDMKGHAKKSGNRYFVMRHAEGEHNIKGIAAKGDETFRASLTETGRGQAEKNASALMHANVTRIIASPLTRGCETAVIVKETLGLQGIEIIQDERLREFDFGELDGKPIGEFVRWREVNTYADRIPGGESYQDVKNRLGAFLYDLERTYQNETILIVTHGVGIETINAVAQGIDADASKKLSAEMVPLYATPIELDFTPLPHNTNYELDLHRPYIDEYALIDTDGAALHRVADVFDCWFESGSMSYAQDHYPFEKDNFNPESGFLKKSKGYPADFIAEGLDQTRGWFYSMIVLGTALFGHSPYKHVIVNGLILAEDGRKMSKSLKNYPEPMDVVAKYGADALRLYLLSSPLMRSEDLRFSEKGVADVGNKIIGRLHNTLVFYQTYAMNDVPESVSSNHVLDRWITARLKEVRDEVTNGLESYELDRAARPLALLVDDLSTWYLRRSRDRVKDSVEAAATLRSVLRTSALLFAPFAPFYAEYLWSKIRFAKDPESVHLADWPEMKGKDEKVLLEDMVLVRELASEALKLRQQAGIVVRQPLASLSAPTIPRTAELIEILKEEVNVKGVLKREGEMSLDTELTDELKREGDVRAFMRALADARKDMNLSPKDVVRVVADHAAKDMLTGLSIAGLAELSFSDSVEGPYTAELSSTEIGFTVTLDAA
ncbi:MAG: isoleucyl-tRNA synthetase [Parcubacteria bacterium C7867-007]|nr:MAG: isoleucyl-tRNA synthetase [Parcubacteria bacterium C7867-007]